MKPRNHIGVCSPSLQAATPDDLPARLAEVGLSRLHLALDPIRLALPSWAGVLRQLEAGAFTAVAGSFGAEGENYATLETIRRTGGFVPDTTWPENRRRLPVLAELAHRLRIPLVTCHAGFMPENPRDPGFVKLVDRVRHIAATFELQGIALALETGQESAAALRAFLLAVDRPNVGVNFDPANVILYGRPDPVGALRALAPWVRQVHVKDAVHASPPGKWGREVPVGEGEVPWPAFFATLREAGFGGDFIIEREAGKRRSADIIQARSLIESLTDSRA